MKWITKQAPRRNIETDILLKIRQRAIDLQREIKGEWTGVEITNCYVQAVMEQLGGSLASGITRKKLEAAYAAHPTELVDALNVVSDLVKKPSFLFTDDDVKRTLFVYEANIGTKEYKQDV